MEILFENSYVRDKALAKEIYRYYYFQRKFLVVCYILLALSFIANMLLSIFGNVNNWGILILIAVYFLLWIFGYYRQVNTMIKRDEEMHGKVISVETIVTDGYIENTASTGAVNRLEYHNVRSAVQTKNLILLRTKANLIYILRKDSFTKGTPQAFIAFIKDKGIKVK